MTINKTALLSGFAFLIVGGLAGYLVSNFAAPPPKDVAENANPAGGRGEPLFYRAPMNPAITSKTPKKDDMGMDYIAVYAEGETGAGPTGTVLIDPVTLQNIGIRTAYAGKKTISHVIRAPGRVAFDEERLSRIHLKTEGWVQKLYVGRTGDTVAAGAVLLSLYSPQLVSSQQEYLLALNNWKIQESSPFPDLRKSAEELVRITRKRLVLLDVPESQIKKLEETGEVKETIQ
ncbi:MAG TPA: efflux RND transporter periplasmic adaptor subunit, partial [Sphingomonadales bacterium]|nr:efflux RND transporter periplasmic adaptor subunit [Sphingomonadales bacterium]